MMLGRIINIAVDRLHTFDSQFYSTISYKANAILSGSLKHCPFCDANMCPTSSTIGCPD